MPTGIEDRPFAPSTVSQGTLNPTFSWWGLAGTMLIFVIILLVALWVIRRLNRSTLRGMDAPWARVLDRQLLGGQQILYLVEVAGKLQILVGSDHYLMKLIEIEDPTLAAEILEEIATRPTERVGGVISGIIRNLQPKGNRTQPFAKELASLLEEVDK
ncbi:MAG: flagellar biosynthetic protein FliO [Desulfitobacteriaceae bacterium]